MAQVREAIAAAARAVVLPDGIGKLTCSGYVPDAVTAPHFFCGEYTVEFDKGMRRSYDDVELTCRVLVGKGDDVAAQRILDALLAGSGPSSLKAAIEAARGAPGEAALGGACDDLHIKRIQGYRWYDHAGASYVGADLVIRIIGEGDAP
ncbi:hypothetical protein [Streptomyces sp. ICN441]|uniref:hypothetical protein n=1 Tax=Streptomyces sp. ICN441 TaxID=2558286 RepID=UPI001F0DBEC6|nr:hypothetical protein [Streptomyces sp. ICN441]